MAENGLLHLRHTLKSLGLACFLLIGACPAYAGIKIFPGLGTKEIIIIDKPTDEGVFASIGGLDKLTLIPNFVVLPGVPIFANVELAPAIAGFATDGTSDLELFAVSPITSGDSVDWLASFDLNPLYRGAATTVGAFSFIESGPLGSVVGRTQITVDEPNALLLGLAGILGLIASSLWKRGGCHWRTQ